MHLPIDKRYKNIYLVGAIITACFAFMIISTAFVMKDISGKTSADLALDRQIDQCLAEQAKKESLFGLGWFKK